jgi:hypothetical protein
MWKNPLMTAIAGVLVGFFVGYLVGQGQPVQQVPAPTAADPHAGVPGAPPLGAAGAVPSTGGRSITTADPTMMERVREVEALLAKEPGNYDNLVQMANALYDINSYSKAAEFYEKAIAQRADSADVLTDLGVCYRETGRHEKALELFDRAADLNPDHWQSRYNACVVRVFDLDDLPGAEQELAKLRQLRGKVAGLPDLAGLEQEIAKRKK